MEIGYDLLTILAAIAVDLQQGLPIVELVIKNETSELLKS